MIRQAFSLWKTERRKKGTTLHRRLVLFFLSSTVTLVLLFTLFMVIFGMTGKEEKAAQNYFNNATNNISASVTEDFGRIAVEGINLAESISSISENYFKTMEICPADLQGNPEYIEGLLAQQAPLLLGTINSRTCGGVYVLLDATVKPDAEGADFAKSGVFLKKTQPNHTQVVGVKLHFLRGPAAIARSVGIELLGQWKMEYDIEGQEFFTRVMETARANPNLPLSRLYYWSGRVQLKDNSEAGFLLCVPLRTSDGTVYGVCGIEVSDRMFKTHYTPISDTYDNVFAVASPSDTASLKTSQGIIAGNYYLTGNRLSDDLRFAGEKNGFQQFAINGTVYSGKSASIRLYPDNSPYVGDAWSVALLMPSDILDEVMMGNRSQFIYIVLALLAVSLLGSFLISRRYLRPVTEALDSIRSSSGKMENRRTVPYQEIMDLFEFLDQKDREHEQVRSQYEKVQLDNSRLAYSRKSEVDPDNYQQFLNNLSTLTPTERDIFNLYIDGRSAKEILDIAGIKENTLKYHNKNIYSKLCVTSRKELLRYAALMKQEKPPVQ